MNRKGKRAFPHKVVTFFTDEGGFGNAKGLIRIDTTNWTEEDWTEIISANAMVRKFIAMQIEHRYKEEKDNK